MRKLNRLLFSSLGRKTSFIAGKKDIVLCFGGGMLAEMDKWVSKMGGKVIVDGAGHWVQAERPAPVNEALMGFLQTVS
jgi:pimeloyl-ACP methyl ester carboxylesterase